MTTRSTGIGLLIGATFLCGLATARAEEAPRPNIVMILADDLGWGDVGWHGSEIKTPNLDRLAESGARLEWFYAQPLCSPTRAALMTGRYPMRLGLQVGVVKPWSRFGLPLDERTLPQALKDAGYETAIVGKWHLGHFQPEYLPTRRGFDHQYGCYNGMIDSFTLKREGGHDWHRDDEESHDEGYSTHLIAREAVRLINEKDPARPLFLYVPFNAVHAPYQAPKKYHAANKDLMPASRRGYAAMVAAMDEAVGEIVAAIDAKGLRENTLIVFSSDNGGPYVGRATSNGPLRGEKSTLFEGGVRVAACASWPGRIPAGSVVDAPLHVVDLYPTFVKLAGGALDQPKPLDGRDAWDAVARGEPTPNATILLNSSPRGGAIRMGDWKLIVGRAVDAEGEAREEARDLFLFNLADDPNEKHDLSADLPEKVAELRGRYDDLAAQAVPPKARPKPASFHVPRVWGQPD